MTTVSYQVIITVSSVFVLLATSFANSAPSDLFLRNTELEPRVLDNNQNYFRHFTCSSSMPCKWAVCYGNMEDESCVYFTNRCSCPESTQCTLTGYAQPEANQYLTKEFRCIENGNRQALLRAS